jgi:hypothetical protein
VICTLKPGRYSLLHQVALFDLVAVNERATETPLLIECRILGKVSIHLNRRVGVARVSFLARSVNEIVVKDVEILISPSDWQFCTFLALAPCTPEGFFSRFLTFRLMGLYRQLVDRVIVHNSARRLMYGGSPSFNTRRILFVRKAYTRSNYHSTLCSI